jgi:hypothetical protein
MRNAIGRLGAAFALVGCAALPSGAQELTGGDGFMYVGTYAADVHVISEEDFSVVARIPAEAGIPGGLLATPDGSRLVAPTIDYEWVEIFDVAERRSIDRFTLTERNAKMRVRAMAVHPDGRHAVIMARRYQKLRDRWDIGDMELFLFDMEGKERLQDVPWPGGAVQETRGSFGFSSDGSQFYFFTDEVHIYDTESYEEVDSWDYSGALDEGMGDFRFGFTTTPREEPDWYAGFFRVSEDIQDRSVIGFARANPIERRVEAKVLGPAEMGPQGSFALAPDRSMAYALRQEVGNYQLWAIDLETAQARHVVFEGRPRMSLEVSSNGRYLYIYAAGNTVDVYDAGTLELRHTIDLDADMTIGRLWILPAR